MGYTHWKDVHTPRKVAEARFLEAAGTGQPLQNPWAPPPFALAPSKPLVAYATAFAHSDDALGALTNALTATRDELAATKAQLSNAITASKLELKNTVIDARDEVKETVIDARDEVKETVIAAKNELKEGLAEACKGRILSHSLRSSSPPIMATLQCSRRGAQKGKPRPPSFS